MIDPVTPREPTPEALALAFEVIAVLPFELKFWSPERVAAAIAPALETGLDRFAEQRVAAAQKVIDEFHECAQYDACMDGPKFKGWDRSALDRLRKKLIATYAAERSNPNTTDTEKAD